MIALRLPLFAIVPLALLAACSQNQEPSSPPIEAASPERGTHVVAGRPARVYVMASFNETCQATKSPLIGVERPPAKGTVTFQQGQETTILTSKSGRCIGQRIPGTGIYYTAREGEKGGDSFTITVRNGIGEPFQRTFNVQIAE